jgi:hypothetical protein
MMSDRSSSGWMLLVIALIVFGIIMWPVVDPGFFGN